MGEWSRVDSEEGDEVAAEEGELEADLGHVVRVHRQRLGKTRDGEENIDVKGNVYLREDEYDDADSKADDDQAENNLFVQFKKIWKSTSPKIFSHKMHCSFTCKLSTPPSHTPPAPG